MQTKRFHLGDHVHAFLHLPEHHVFTIKPVRKKGRKSDLSDRRVIQFWEDMWNSWDNKIQMFRKSILPFSFSRADEELGAVGVWPWICHWERSCRDRKSQQVNQLNAMQSNKIMTSFYHRAKEHSGPWQKRSTTRINNCVRWRPVYLFFWNWRKLWLCNTLKQITQ